MDYFCEIPRKKNLDVVVHLGGLKQTVLYTQSFHYKDKVTMDCHLDRYLLISLESRYQIPSKQYVLYKAYVDSVLYDKYHW